MSLTTNTALSTRTLTYAVRIYTTVIPAGSPSTPSGPSVLLNASSSPTSATGVAGVVSLRISKSFDSPVPVCTLELNRMSNWITRGMGVTVDVGYNGLTNRLFTGFVQSRERGVGKGSINCMGRLWTAFRTVQIGDRDVDGVTVSSAIGTILDYVGITDNRLLDIPAFTLGTASTPTLSRMPASQQLQMLMDIDGCRIYELGTGLIICKVIDEAPAATSFKTYTSNANASARVLEASDREDPEYYRNRVIVTGATVTEGTVPDETSRTITATATNTGSALVQPALPSGTYIDAEYNNQLIDTDAKAASVAIRLLAKFARIPRQLQIELAGDPELELGQTIAFVMPELDLNDRGFISGIEHSIDSNGYVTRLTDFRGAGDTGGTLSQNPIAAFTFTSEREVFGDAIQVVAALNASASFDPDGTIASYAWSDNQITTPEISTLTTQQVTVRADTSLWTGSWSVTLTVTDNDGLTGSTTITVPYKNTDAAIVIPAIYAAINNNASATLDGAVTWKDSSHSTTISVGARPSDGVNVGYACYGDSTGHIYRTTDGCATLTPVYTSAAGVAINDVQWDWRNGNVVWALDENAIVYISVNAGVTWTIYASLRTKLSLAGALGNKLGLPAAGGVWIFGGTGAGSPLIAFDPVVGSQGWVQQTFTGDLQTDTVTTPADATMRIIDAVAGFSKTVLILAWASGGGASITAVYAGGVIDASSVAYTRASTTFGALKSGRYVVSDNVLLKSDQYYCGFANRSQWSSTDGIAWTETTNFFPAGVTPNHAVMMGDQSTGATGTGSGIAGLFGVFCYAASDGIYKFTSRIDTTASYLRPSTFGTAWPASAVGKKLSIGASGATSAAGAAAKVVAATRSASPRTSTFLNATTVWSTLLAMTGITDNDPRIYCLTTTNWFVTNGSGTPAYSKDGGASWAALSASVAKAIAFCKDAGGRVWALVSDSANISISVWYSDNSGDTWTVNIADTGFNTRLSVGAELAAHPTDQNKIVFIAENNAGTWRTYHTENRGTSWTQTTGGTRPVEGQTGVQWYYSMIMLPTGRLIASGPIGGTGAPVHWRIMTSDDNGVTWATKYTDDNTSNALYSHADAIGNSGKIVMWHWDSATTTFSPIISTDGGQTFTLTPLTNTLAAFVGAANQPDAVAYDAANDAAYVMGAGTNFKVVKFTPVTAAGTWLNYNNTFPATTYGSGGLAAIP